MQKPPQEIQFRHEHFSLPEKLRVAGCCEKRGSEPVRFGLARGADCALHRASFYWRQSDRKNDRYAFCRQPGPAHFLSHKNIYFRLRKYLTRLCTLVYKSLISKCETRFCQKSARTSSARLANQRHPAVTGAGNERLAMTVQEHQGTFAPQSRSLKIQPVGDFWKKQLKPQILLNGKWLERAGFEAGHRVEVVIEQPGTITLRFVAQPKEVAL